MADRKGTPDILGDILGGAAALSTPEAAPPSTSAPSAAGDPGVPKPAAPRAPKEARSPLQMPPPKTAKPGSEAAAPAVTPAPPAWTYTRVTFHDYGGWRARLRDGAELPGWKQGTGIDAYLAAMGAEGWELVGVVAGERSQWQAFFKRPLS